MQDLHADLAVITMHRVGDGPVHFDIGIRFKALGECVGGATIVGTKSTRHDQANAAVGTLTKKMQTTSDYIRLYCHLGGGRMEDFYETPITEAKRFGELAQQAVEREFSLSSP